MKGKVTGFLLECVETADAGCENYADAVFIVAFVVKISVLDCLVGGGQRVHGVEVELAGFLAVEMVGGIEAFHFACELCLELGSVKVCDRTGPAHALEGVLPCRLGVVSDRRQSTDTCHYNSF